MTDEQERTAAYLKAKWTPRPPETLEEYQARRKRMVELVAPQWAEKMNVEYGLEPGVEYFARVQDDGTGHPDNTKPMPGTENLKVEAYRPEDMAHDEQLEQLYPGQDNNRAPLATDLFSFVYYLRKNTDFFSGPELDIHFPEADSPEFYEVLAVEALEYTGE